MNLWTETLLTNTPTRGFLILSAVRAVKHGSKIIWHFMEMPARAVSAEAGFSNYCDGSLGSRLAFGP